MKRFLALALSLTLCIGLLAGCGGSASGSNSSDATSNNDTAGGNDDPIVLTFGQLGDDSENDYMSKYTRHFMELVEEKTNGQITFDFYPNCQLGSEQSMMDQMISGTLDMAVLSSTIIGSIYPDYAMCVLPFAFSNTDEFRAAENAGAFDGLADVAADGPIKFISPMVIAFRGFSNTKHAVRCASDMKGLTCRVLSGEIYADMFNALGVNTSNITFSEIYSALQQGVIEAEDNPLNYVMQYKFYEQEIYHTMLGMTMGVNPLMISEKAMAKLTDEQYEIIVAAAKEAEIYGDTEYNKIMDQAGADYVAAGGSLLKMGDLTDEERQSFKDATADVWDKYAAQLTPAVYEQYMEARQTAGLE